MLVVMEFESAVHGHSYLYYSFLEVLNDGDVHIQVYQDDVGTKLALNTN